MDIVVQCNPQSAFHNTQCVQDKTLITSLQTTIEVMEAEIKSLKDEGIIGLRPRITGMVKPGANLPSVTSDTLPPHDISTILIAGTYITGEHSTLLQCLNKHIAAKLSSSVIIVSTLPHCFDLAADPPVNDTRGDRNMHLKMPRKRLFAKLIMKALLNVNIRVGDPSSAAMASLIGHRPQPDLWQLRSLNPMQGSLLLLAFLLPLNLVMILLCLLNSI
ncbi:hypothetical protein J6590_067890 [Homalodisca vitripennis]|nr:hypothetical protein J6590_067890 [Homalodisca vitripennis]